MLITYPYHPRCGNFIRVVGAKRHAGCDHLIIRQPDRTLALLPAWMIEPNPPSYELVHHPRLPLQRLAELHTLISMILPSPQGESPQARGAGDEERAKPSRRSVRRAEDQPAASHRVADTTRPHAPSPAHGSGNTEDVSRSGGSNWRGGRQ
ncbi:MAG: DUF5372 family protein [Microvirga sp.]